MMINPTAAANAQAAREALAALEAEREAAALRVPVLQAKAHAANAALAEVENALRTGDNRLGQVDLIERDTAKRAAALAAEGAVSKHAQLVAQLPSARTTVLAAELEAGEHPMTRGMADADAKLQAAIMDAIKDWRTVAAGYSEAWLAIARSIKGYDPQRVSMLPSGTLVIDGESYRGITPASQFEWERNFSAARLALIREDSAQREAEADLIAE